jgi:YesN/AraC family two-component response regulator
LVFKLEDKLITDLNEPEDIVLRNINMLFDELKMLEYNSIVFSMVRLHKKIMDVVNDTNQKYSDNVVKFPYTLNYNIMENYCLDEIKEEILSTVAEIRSKQPLECKQNKDSSIVLEAKKIIDNEYSNVDLNASRISEALSISSSRLSSIFNRYMNMTIPEYLNTVRFMKAAELLKNSDLNISTIMHKIGVSNESYFYRLFKNKYKMTPREYVAAQKEVK